MRYYFREEYNISATLLFNKIGKQEGTREALSIARNASLMASSLKDEGRGPGMHE